MDEGARLAALYQKYQLSGQQWQFYGVRSMDMDDPPIMYDRNGVPSTDRNFEDNVSRDAADYISPWADWLVGKGIIRHDDRKAATEEINRYGTLYYEPANLPRKFGSASSIEPVYSTQPVGTPVTYVPPAVPVVAAPVMGPFIGAPMPSSETSSAPMIIAGELTASPMPDRPFADNINNSRPDPGDYTGIGGPNTYTNTATTTRAGLSPMLLLLLAVAAYFLLKGKK